MWVSGYVSGSDHDRCACFTVAIQQFVGELKQISQHFPRVKSRAMKFPMILTFCLRAAISNSGDNVSDRPIVPEILWSNLRNLNIIQSQMF